MYRCCTYHIYDKQVRDGVRSMSIDEKLELERVEMIVRRGDERSLKKKTTLAQETGDDRLIRWLVEGQRLHWHMYILQIKQRKTNIENGNIALP